MTEYERQGIWANSNASQRDERLSIAVLLRKITHRAAQRCEIMVSRLKKLKINYLFIMMLALLLLIMYWSLSPWLRPQKSQLAQIIRSGELRISMLASPLTVSRNYDDDLRQNPNSKDDQHDENTINSGLDYELAHYFARYLGVRLHITVRQSLGQLFADLDSGQADVLASSLVYDQRRSQRYQAGPAYYSVSQQLVYQRGKPRPKTLSDTQTGTLTIAAGQSISDVLTQLKAQKYPQLHWQVDSQHSSQQLLSQVANGKLDYTIADSAAINFFQRVHPQLAVALDVTDEQPVTWFSLHSDDNSLSAALLDFFRRMHEDGTLSMLEEKYFGHGEDFDYVDTSHFLQAVDELLPDLQPLFEKYANGLDWRLLAAVAWQESHWDAQATSPTGVRGIMMLTKETAQSLGLSDRLDAAQSISGGARYLEELIDRVPKSVPEGERVWFALAAYNMGFAHMMDARQLTELQKGNPDSWSDVKQRLPMLSQKAWYSKTRYGYAPGRQAYLFVENIRKYQISLEGYLREKEREEDKEREKEQEKAAGQLAQQQALAGQTAPAGAGLVMMPVAVATRPAGIPIRFTAVR